MGAVCLVLGACAAPAAPPLYFWESFADLQYSALQRDGKSPEGQLQIMEAELDKARSLHASLPPGYRAHMGMLYLQAGNTQKARAAWQDEKTAFPESAAYMDRLTSRLDGGGTTVGQAAPPAVGAPATDTKNAKE
jgi:hypothetical protein